MAIQAGTYLASTPSTLAFWLVGPLALVSGLGLIVGFLTPAAAAVASVTAPLIAAAGSPASDPGFSMNTIAAALVVSDTVALALLGPGAHSIDARLFGRREIIIQSEGARP